MIGFGRSPITCGRGWSRGRSRKSPSRSRRKCSDPAYRINWDVFNKMFPLTLDSESESEISQDRPRKRRRPRQPVGDLMTVRQVAEKLAVDTATITSWIRSGQLKASNVGKGHIRPRWRIIWGTSRLS